VEEEGSPIESRRANGQQDDYWTNTKKQEQVSEKIVRRQTRRGGARVSARYAVESRGEREGKD